MANSVEEYCPFVSILIPVKDVARYIEKCLDAILNQDYPKDKYEILVLDNKSSDGTQEIVSQYGEPVRLIQTGIDSPARKYNLVIDQTKGSILGLVDGDANVSKDWLKKVIAPLSDPRVAGATGLILTHNKESLVARVIGYELQYRYENLPRKIKRAATMHTVYKKEVLVEVGRFNERLKTGYDCEIGHRITSAGFDIIFVKDALVYHNHRSTLGSYFQQQYEYGKFAILRYLESPRIAMGDEIASLSMILQPIFYLGTLLFLISFLVFHTSFILALIPLSVLLGYYIFSSIRLVKRYKDPLAFFTLFIYIIRPMAWSLGAAVMLLNLKGKCFTKK